MIVWYINNEGKIVLKEVNTYNKVFSVVEENTGKNKSIKFNTYDLEVKEYVIYNEYRHTQEKYMIAGLRNAEINLIINHIEEQLKI